MLTQTRKPKDIQFQRKLHQMARGLRHTQTEAEQILWQKIKGSQLLDCKFRRQVPIDKYIVDFCCLKKKLIIEVDGPIHELQKGRDINKDYVLSKYGFKVLRFSNDNIMNDMDSVLNEISRNLN